ncbi:helix-turn-helix domain-containing protein [Cohnella sp. CFH 77786]|uniref:AraC family transcriptional regulator n=1 Tax=Cohnella sp. CFH 77786 TaxID=2662265 RepID=UPI001C610449|nr:AraC family transcriptional regulator [Cohnella sp. CFH 77786]MBW5445746.1 helix-turn-helix domain-containing protein [Cohnella sp. CFH 77786]
MDRFAFLMQQEIELRLPIYVSGAGHWDNQETIVRPEGFPLFQWLHCAAGEGELKVAGESSRVREGTGFFLYPNEPHEYRAISEPWEIYWIVFGGELAEPLARLAGLTRSGVYSVTDDGLIRHIQNALTLASAGKPLAGLECSKLVYMLLIDIMKCITVDRPSVEQNYMRLQPVFEYMELHYDRKITLEELADVMGVSIQHLCLLFRKIVKTRPIEYLNQLRIHKSKGMMLRDRDARISEIARKVGLDAPGYFSTLFKRVEGMTPEAFRKISGVR